MASLGKKPVSCPVVNWIPTPIGHFKIFSDVPFYLLSLLCNQYIEWKPGAPRAASTWSRQVCPTEAHSLLGNCRAGDEAPMR